MAAKTISTLLHVKQAIDSTLALVESISDLQESMQALDDHLKEVTKERRLNENEVQALERLFAAGELMEVAVDVFFGERVWE